MRDGAAWSPPPWIIVLTGLEGAGIIALWAVAIVRAPQGIRSREQRPLWFAIVVIALAMSMHLDPVTAVLARVVPSAHWVDLATHLFSIVDAAAVLWFILQAARRRMAHGFGVRRRCRGHGRPGAPGHRCSPACTQPDHPLTGHPQRPGRLLVDLLRLPPERGHHLRSGVLAAQPSGQRPPSLRYGLRLFGTGILLASLLWVLKLGYLGTRSTVFAPLFSPVTGAEALFIASGVALPFLIQMRALLGYRRSHRSLAPLWRDLITAAPDVVLSPGNRLRAAAVPIQLRLYRRVIEIRDAMIVLRSYVAEATAEQARRRRHRPRRPRAHGRCAHHRLLARRGPALPAHRPDPQSPVAESRRGRRA